MSLHPARRSPLGPWAGLTLLALGLACGGGSAKPSSASTAPATPAPKPAPALPEPFWTSDAPVRPEVARLVQAQTQTSAAAVVALSPAETPLVHRAVAAAPAQVAELPTVSGQLRIVTGLRSFTYHLDTTTSLQPFDLSASTIQALVPNTVGGFDTLPGVGHSDGTFSVSGVGEGGYWLRFGTTYLWTTASHVDWSNDLFGRADTEYPSIDPTSLAFSLSNLNAWQGTDELLWEVPNQGFYSNLPLTSAAVTGAPVLGATALTGFTLNVTNPDLGFGLLDATKGDQAYLNQLTTRPAGAESYRALAKSFVAPATTQADGSATPFTGGFMDLPQSATLRLNWRRSLFAAFAPSVNPAATPSGSFFFAYAYPLGSTYGLPFNAFQLLDYTNPTATADVDLGDLPLGNPFPASWSLAAEAYEAFNVNYMAPGASAPVTMTRYAYQATTTLPTATAPMTPLVGPVQAPKINGKDLFTNQLAVGLTPTLSWSAPAVGASSGYAITCYRLFNSGGNSSLARVAAFRSKTSPITIPPGILTAGNTYVFTISAIRANGVDFASTPLRTSLPYGFTTVMTAIVAP